MISSKLALSAIISLSLCQGAFGRGLRKNEESIVSTPINHVSSEVEKFDEVIYPVDATSVEAFQDAIAGLNLDDLDGLNDEISMAVEHSSSTEGDNENRMLSGTGITITNDCSTDTIRTYVYHDRLQVFWMSPGASKTFETTRDSFYIFAEKLNGDIVLEGTSGFCFEDGRGCLLREDISNNDVGNNIDYPITCGESASSSTTTSTSPPASTTTTTGSTTSNEWLTQHNKRRLRYHEKYGESYVPLVWNNDLEEKAQAWANELISRDSCGIQHAPWCSDFQYGGENLAGTLRTTSAPPSEDSVLTRWTENEESAGYSDNGHFRQVLWRATTELGCAVASKPLDNGSYCHIAVCRYSVPGNCKVNEGDWEEKMLADTSPCGNTYCPGE